MKAIRENKDLQLHNIDRINMDTKLRMHQLKNII